MEASPKQAESFCQKTLQLENSSNLHMEVLILEGWLKTARLSLSDIMKSNAGMYSHNFNEGF